MGRFPSLYPWVFLHYDTMILQSITFIVGDAGFELGTSAPEVWCATNEPPHLHLLFVSPLTVSPSLCPSLSLYSISFTLYHSPSPTLYLFISLSPLILVSMSPSQFLSLSLFLSPSWPLSPLLMYKELAWLTSRWYINKNIKKSSSGYPPLPPPPPPPPPPHNITNNGAQCAAFLNDVSLKWEISICISPQLIIMIIYTVHI